tara:strand:+ start:560 stop:1333 length:774 start_codon:yes stop_codon:yes gene_type:complete
MCPIGIGVPFLLRTITESEAAGIVTADLLIHVDASVPASYPGSGTTWTDLKANYNGTLVNGPTYSSDDGGQIVFDGTDDLCDFGNVTEQVEATAFTMQMWFNLDDNTHNNRLWGRRRNSDNKIISGWVHSNGSVYFFNANDTANQNAFKTGQTFNEDTWYNVAWVFDGSGATNADRAKIYLDGSELTSLSFGSNGVPTETFDFPSYEKFQIGSDRPTTQFSNQRLEGSIGEFMQYTSALEASDVLANFNATKSRYGK